MTGIWVVLTIAGQISKSESGLTLDLQTCAVHEHDQAGHELGLRLREFLAVVSIDSDVTQRCGAVVLHIGVCRI